jgi:putative ABC transport system permease protein
MLAFYAERLAEPCPPGRRRVRIWSRILLDLIGAIALEWIHFLSSSPAPTAAARPPLSLEDRMSVIALEIAYAVRVLKKSLAFTAAAIVTPALGISSTTAIFSLVHSVLLAPLPFPDADRLVVPQSYDTRLGGAWSVTYGDFMDWRDNHVFKQVAVYQQVQMDLTGPAEPVRVKAVAVTPQFFGALGVAPAMGRLLGDMDYAPDAAPGVVISNRLWRTQFGSRPDIVGSTVEMNGLERSISGVLPEGARWPDEADAWIPMRIATEQDADLQRRDNYVFSAVARLAPGTTLQATQAKMEVLARRAAALHPDIRAHTSTMPTPALEWALGPTTPRALWILLGAVGLLLVIGCVNVANLQLARAAARHRELAVRTALGASRWKLVRQMLVESGVLALAGGALAVPLASAMIRLIVTVAPPDVPRLGTASIDLPALAFACAISIAVALAFGLAPAVVAARSDPQQALGDGGTRTSGGRSRARTRRALVVVELALSVILLVGAGLALRSILELQHTDAGFTTRNVLTASISLPSVRYNSAAKVVAFMYGLRDRLAAAPEVEAAGIASASPLGGGGFYLGRVMVAEGRDQSPSGEVPINWNVATPGYFAALQLPIIRGRDFTAQDDSAHPPVMIVNEKFARMMFPNENPIGKRAMSSRDEKLYREIVGVVPDVKYYGAGDTARALVWVPYAQRNAWHEGILTVRTRGDPLAALPIVRHALHELDSGIALADVETMDDARARSMAGDRLVAILLGAFAGLALVLAAVGIFGVLSYMIEQRSHELGIRLALGALPTNVIGLVARETVPMIAAGAAIGVVVAFGLTRFIRSLLYGITPGDPVTFVGVALLLGVVGIVAAILPARRAARINPVVALRNE